MKKAFNLCVRCLMLPQSASLGNQVVEALLLTSFCFPGQVSRSSVHFITHLILTLSLQIWSSYR